MSVSGLYTVFGGTGYLGRRIVLRLLAQGHRVRIAARRPVRHSDLYQSDRAEPVVTDIADPDTLPAAVAGADGVANATSLYLETATQSFRSFHGDSAGQLARLAEARGIGRLVQLSGIGADARSTDPYIAARGFGEQAVREACPGAVIVRPSVMVGHGDGFLGAIRTLVRSPVVLLFGRGETRLQPVHVGDAAAAIAEMLRVPEPAQFYECGGPTVWTYREIVLAVAEAARRRIWPVPVPFTVWRLLAAVTEHLPGAPLTRTQIALAEADNVASDTAAGLAKLGITPRGLREGIRAG